MVAAPSAHLRAVLPARLRALPGDRRIARAATDHGPWIVTAARPDAELAAAGAHIEVEDAIARPPR